MTVIYDHSINSTEISALTGMIEKEAATVRVPHGPARAGARLIKRMDGGLFSKQKASHESVKTARLKRCVEIEVISLVRVANRNNSRKPSMDVRYLLAGLLGIGLLIG